MTHQRGKAEPAVEPKTRPPGPKERRPHREPPRPPSEQHRRLTQIMQTWFRLFPLEGARWVLDASFRHRERFRVHEARWIEQPPKGPSHLVPPPRQKDDVPRTAEDLVGHLLRESILDEAKKSDGDLRVEILEFDGAEAMRQTLAAGGCDIELLLEAEYDGAKPKKWLLGVMLPDEQEGGSETSWELLRATSWHLLVAQHMAQEDEEMPHMVTVPLYLWPGTGLHDPQENCSVIRGGFQLPGLLGSLLDLASKQDAERDSRRKTNRDRMAFHQRVDQERRAAAARRRDRTGDAGITEEALAALIPDIDVDKDFVSLMTLYEIVRLWDDSMDAMLASLPPPCLGLALFGHRPAGLSDEAAFERCAFELRRALRGRTDSEARRAGAALAVLGTAFIDSTAAEGLLRKMKLL